MLTDIQSPEWPRNSLTPSFFSYRFHKLSDGFAVCMSNRLLCRHAVMVGYGDFKFPACVCPFHFNRGSDFNLWRQVVLFVHVFIWLDMRNQCWPLWNGSPVHRLVIGPIPKLTPSRCPINSPSVRAFSRSDHHIKGHPKPSGAECKWTIKP